LDPAPNPTIAQCYPARFKSQRGRKVPVRPGSLSSALFFRGKIRASDWIGPPDLFYKRVARTGFLAARVNDLLRTDVYGSWSAALAPGSCSSKSEDLTALTTLIHETQDLVF
jgi:hypothetical protein